MKSTYMTHCCGFMQTSGQSWLPFFTIILFAILVGLSIVRFVYYRTDSDELITQEVVRLALIIEQIDRECNIIDFDEQRIPINFLNVAKFVGSEVGAMNIAYPEQWTGPYLTNNPTIQGKEFQIVTTKQGYFVAPGDGVKLSNGKIIGKDIVLDYNVNMRELMADPQALSFRDKPLAASIRIQKSAFQQLMLKDAVHSYGW